MNRKSFTAILLGGALAGGCSKPNPLFLDTWDVVTDSGSQGPGSAVTVEPTTVDPPTTSTEPAVTTTSSSTSPSTITSSSDNTTTTTEPNPTTETTGEPFVCDGLDIDMEGCCEVEVKVEADTFFSDASDGVVGSCGVTEEVQQVFCSLLSFGKTATGSLSRDDGNNSAVEGVTLLALKFKAQDGQLVSNQGPIVTDTIASLRLELAGTYDPKDFGGQFQFEVHALDAGLTWVEEGDASECVDGLSSFACRACKETVDEPCGGWNDMAEPVPAVLDLLGTVAVVGQEMNDVGSLNPIDLDSLDDSEWKSKIAGGTMVLAPKSSKYMGAEVDVVPWPGIQVHTRESNMQPKLVARVCKP